MATGYKVVNVEIEGDGALVMHNGQTADPLNPYAKALKQISGKKKKVDADYEKMAEIEWDASLYLDEHRRRVIIPDNVIESCIVNGARASKEGKTATTSIFVENDAEFFVNGKPVLMEEIKGKPEFELKAMVKVKMSRVVRTRPIFRNWSAKFSIHMMEGVTNAAAVKGWVENAGALVGLCDWRPRFGRFRIKSFEQE